MNAGLMVAAVLTTMLFAMSAAAGTRSASLIGPANANFVRLVVAALVLAVYAHGFGQGIGGPALGIFLLSGLVGFGMGDMALYEAYDRIGSRLAMVLCQCLAAPLAGGIEWMWMGTRVGGWQVLWGATVLAGVGLALAPGRGASIRACLAGPGRQEADKNVCPTGLGFAAKFRVRLWTGVGCGCLAALGQAGGAVLSRRGFAVCQSAGFRLDGMTATYQRILPGVAVAALAFVLIRFFRRPFSRSRIRELRPEQAPGAAGWVMVNALSGAVLGVACYQWALATTPSGVVLAIVAVTPIVVMPLAWALEGDRPTRRAVAGAVLAVAGVIGLALAPEL